MAINVGNLVASFELRAAQFISETKKVNRTLGQLEKRSQKFGRVFARSFATAFAAAGASLSFGFARQVGEAAATLDDFAIRIGVSARELQAWQLAAVRSGIETNQFNLALQRATRRAAEAAVNLGEAQTALLELGVDAAKFNRLTLDDKILDLAAAFEAVGNEEDKLRLAFKLFDSEGTAVLQFLKEGEAGLQALRKELDGQVWSDETRKALKDASTELRVWGETIKIASGNALAFVREGGAEFLDWLEETIKKTPFLDKAAESFLKFFRATSGARGVSPGLSPEARAATVARETSLGAGAVSADEAKQIVAAARATGSASIKPNAAFTGFTSKEQVAQDTIITKLKEEQALREKIAEDQRRFAVDQGERSRQAAADRLQAVEDENAAFTDLFTRNLVQAQEDGFKAVLQGWSRTLQQMVAKALTANLIGALFPKGFATEGGFLSGLGIPGFNSGGSFRVGGRGGVDRNLVAFRATRGETVSVSRAGENVGRGQVINVDARGSTMSAEQVRAAVARGVIEAEQRVAERARRR